MSLINISQLDFSYKNQKLFQHLNLSFAENQWVGILGLNGTGKSTLLKILLGHLIPHHGKVEIANSQPGSQKLRSLIGSSPQDIDFPENIRVREILQFVRGHFQNPLELKELIDDFFLADFANKKCGELSGGMKRRVSLACAFVGRPKVIILDEPMTGLDSQSRRQLLKNIARHRQQNKSLLLMISHHPEDISQLVDTFLLIKKEEDPRWIPPETIAELTQMKIVSFENDGPIKLSKGISTDLQHNKFRITTTDSDQLIVELNQKTQNYKNLRIEDIPLDVLLREHL